MNKGMHAEVLDLRDDRVSGEKGPETRGFREGTGLESTDLRLPETCVCYFFAIIATAMIGKAEIFQDDEIAQAAQACLRAPTVLYRDT